MKKKLTTIAFLLAATLPAAAQQWSFGAGAGPFIYGNFVERTLRPGNETGPSGEQTLILTAATRPGLSVDFERTFTERWAVRFEGTFTRAPLSVETHGGDEDGTEIDAGEVDIATFMAPLLFRINPRGTFRFHLHGGPAYALYRLRARENASGARPPFDGTEGEWGLAFGGGMAWWFSDRFAIEGNLTDIVTTSPFEEANEGIPGTDVPYPHNVHTSVGIRWKF